MSRRVALVETPGKYAAEQRSLHALLAARGCGVAVFDPQAAAAFDPRGFDLVVNRLSATAYDRPGPPVFATARDWLARAEAELGADRVVNGAAAVLADTSKVVQDDLLRPFGVAPLTVSFPSLAALRDAPAAPPGRVFLKLASGGSGSGTRPFGDFDEIRREPFDAAFRATEARLTENLRALHADPRLWHTVVVQRAVEHDPDEPVYRDLARQLPGLDAAAARWVLRVECFGGRVRFAAWMARVGTNFCHAGVCSVGQPAEVVRLADATCPVPESVRDATERIAAAAGMRQAGVEWVRDAGGRWFVIDVNGLSIFRTDPYPNDPTGFRPWDALADHLAALAGGAAVVT